MTDYAELVKRLRIELKSVWAWRDHWYDRAEKAEAEIERLRERVHYAEGTASANIDRANEAEEGRTMSAKIWQDIYNAVEEVNPSLLEEFNQCRDTPTIMAFLDEHFPLPDEEWEHQLFTAIPAILRTHWTPL